MGKTYRKPKQWQAKKERSKHRARTKDYGTVVWRPHQHIEE